MRAGSIFLRKGQSAELQEIRSEVADCFEPMTFCMAIRPVIWRVRYQNLPICRRFSDGATGARRRQYAWMCADMRRFGPFRPEVPEIKETGSNRLIRAQRPNAPRALPANPAAPPRSIAASNSSIDRPPAQSAACLSSRSRNPSET
jgi:hypothetical protein